MGPWGSVRGAIIASLVLAAASARADDAPRPSSVPSFARFKPLVDDLEHKEEGNFVSGLPLVGYDTNTGLGLGVGGYFTMDGKRTDALFPVTPYRHRFFAQAYATTGGFQQHILSYDGIYIKNTPYRVRAQIMFERNTNANYFGVGESTLGPMTFRGSRIQTSPTWDKQTFYASQLQPDRNASPNYNHYEYDTPSGQVTLERDFWGGRIRVQYGFIAQRTWITRYDGTLTQALDGERRRKGVAPVDGNTIIDRQTQKPIEVTHGTTKLGMDCGDPNLDPQVTGCYGGWNNMLKAGIVLDTRDFEPDPTKGFFIDAVGEWSSRAFGSTNDAPPNYRFPPFDPRRHPSSPDYVRLTATARAYWSPFPKLTNLVLAVRLLYSMQFGDVPFFVVNTLAMTEGDQTGLGGERTLRGFRADRFTGHFAALGNAELRWTFVHFKLFQQRFSLQIAPLIDVGTVFDDLGFQHKPCDQTNTCGSDTWKVSGGAGLRVGWNRSSIIMFDFGKSSEDFGFYIDFGMPF